MRACDPGDGHAVPACQGQVDLLRLVQRGRAPHLRAVQRQVFAAACQAAVEGHLPCVDVPSAGAAQEPASSSFSTHRDRRGQRL